MWFSGAVTVVVPDDMGDEIRRERDSPENETWAETWSVYEEINELLKTEPLTVEVGEEIGELMGRLVELHKISDAEDLDRAAVWVAEHPIPWTEGKAA